MRRLFGGVQTIEESDRGDQERTQEVNADVARRFSKTPYLESVPTSERHVLPLYAPDYPPTPALYQFLSEKTKATSVVMRGDRQLKINVIGLINQVGGFPSQPSSDPQNPFWEELNVVVDYQLKRQESPKADVSQYLPTFPQLWKGFTLHEAAEAVHDEYPGYWQGKFIESLVKDGLQLDETIIPKRSQRQFLNGIVALADINTWSIRAVGPHSFCAKWLAGRMRPEEVAWLIASDKIGALDGVPKYLLSKVKSMKLGSAEEFTDYAEGSPTHPSWPAMHSAASQASLWLAVVINLTPEQHEEAKRVDHAVAMARTIAGVHYFSDNYAGLNIGQDVVARLLPGYLNMAFGSNRRAVARKIQRMRFRWGAPELPTYSSPNLYKYHPMVKFSQALEKGFVIFSVVAPNDAHIALGENTLSDGPNYEIVLGGWRNSRSRIRGANQRSTLDEYLGPVVDPNEPVLFRISWDKDLLKVERSSNHHKSTLVEIMKFDNRSSSNYNHAIKHMMVSTGWGATGEWKILEWSSTPSYINPTKNPKIYKPVLDFSEATSQSGFVIFTVTAPNDAYVALGEEKALDAPNSYQIVLDGWKKSQSAIRAADKKTILAKYGGTVLRDEQEVMFRISWTPNTLLVEQSLENEKSKLKEIMKLVNRGHVKDHHYIIKHMMIGNGLGRTATWEWNIIDFGSNLSFETPDVGNVRRYTGIIRFSEESTKSGSVTFAVDATNDAHIALSEGKTNVAPRYEICLGGWKNTKSQIRSGRNLRFDEHVGSVLKPSEEAFFRLSWNETMLKVERSTSSDEAGFVEIMKYKSRGIEEKFYHEIKYMSILTGYGSKGKWRILK